MQHQLPPQASQGSAWPDKAAPGFARQAWQGRARHGTASQARQGTARHGTASQAGPGAARPGAASQAGRGAAWRGSARHITHREGESGVPNSSHIFHYQTKQTTPNNTMTDTIKIDKPERKARATEAVMTIAEKHGGTVTPEILLAEAKRKASPLHGFFCWDNTEAADRYRKIQAAEMIRRVKVTITRPDETALRIRAFVNVHEPQPADGDEPDDIDRYGINIRPRGIYVNVQDALRIEDYRSQMITQCKRDVEAFRQKYSALSEAARILDAMEGFTTEFAMP